MGKLAVKSVRLLAGAFVEEVVAVVSTGSPVSSMSERLANKLHVKKLCPARVENLGFVAGGFLPERAVHVSCQASLKHEDPMILHPTIGGDKAKVPVAFMIMPSPFHEVVLGVDWLSAASNKIGGSVIISKTDETPREKNYIHVGEGEPTRGPGYVEGANSMGHLLTVNEKDYAKLKELVETADGTGVSN